MKIQERLKFDGVWGPWDEPYEQPTDPMTELLRCGWVKVTVHRGDGFKRQFRQAVGDVK